MKSDELISKYLDGELSQREDEQLRRQIAADPLLKAEFNTAVMLHISSRENLQNDNLPEDEFLAVENIVLASVRRPSPSVHHTLTRRPLSILSAYTRRLAAAAILLAASIPISDTIMQKVGGIGYFTLNIPPELHNNTPNITAKRANKLIVDGKSSRKNIAEYSVGDKSEGNITANLSEPPFEQNISEMPAAYDAELSQNSSAVANEDNDSRYGNISQGYPVILPQLSKFNTAKQDISQSESITSDIALSLFDTEHPTEVQLTTFASNGMLKIGDNSSSTASISQSIGYAVNVTGRIGLEVGLIGYSVTYGGKIAIPTVAGRNGKGGVQGADNNSAQSSAHNDAGGEYETRDVSFTNDKTVYWGAAFYEQTLLNKGNLTLNARLGAGASPEGPMAYGRTFARYEVLSGISLTLGAESRLQTFQTSMSESLRRETSTGVSIVYGIQAKF